MQYDCVVIGGSFAGQSAAMIIARGRRTVCVVDSGLPRNRFTAASHGFFGRDGAPPLEMIAEAKAKLLAYPSVAWRSGEALAVRGDDRIGFTVDLASGEKLSARKIILACGVSDSLPDVPGLWERWGHTVNHCPYCHGYEFGGAPLGVLNAMPLSSHQALLIPEWGPTTFFLDGGASPDEETLRKLKARGVTIEPSPVVGLEGEAPQLSGVRLADGRVIRIVALYTASTVRVHPLVSQTGCTIDDGPMGQVIRTDEFKQTTVPGVYAAGDTARMPHNATLASADGVIAGSAVHRALVFEPLG